MDKIKNRDCQSEGREGTLSVDKFYVKITFFTFYRESQTRLWPPEVQLPNNTTPHHYLRPPALSSRIGKRGLNIIRTLFRIEEKLEK